MPVISVRGWCVSRASLSVLQCVAVVLQCFAECCSVLQCVKVCCSVLQWSMSTARVYICVCLLIGLQSA